MKNNFTKILLSTALAPAILSVPAIISSCGPTNWVEPIEMVNVIDEHYEPRIQPCKDPDIQRPMSQNEVIDAYISRVNKDKTIFQNDMLDAAVGAAKFIQDNITTEYTMEECYFGFSKPTFGKTSVWEWGFEEIPFDTISFDERISAKFVYKVTDVTVEETINFNVSYNNVFFYLYENFENENSNWHIGLLDKTLENECLWPYSRDVHPWSINYDCSYLCTTTYIDPITHEPFEIHNCSYYSGLVDNVAKLTSFYKESLTKEDAFAIDYISSNLILLLKYDTHYFSQVISNPDIALTEQLNSSITNGDDNVRIYGLKLIESTSGDLKIQSIKIRTESRVVLREVNPSSDKQHLIQVGEQIQTPSNSNDSNEIWQAELLFDEEKQRWYFPGHLIAWSEGQQVNPSFDETDITYTFTISHQSFPIRIIFEGGSLQPVNTEVRLHYNSMLLTVK